MDIIKLIVISIFILSCTKEKNTFKLDETIVSSIKSNKNCLTILENSYGITNKYIDKNNYVESLVDRFIKYNGDNYSRALLFKLKLEGEVITSETFSLVEKSTGQIQLIKYTNDTLTTINIKNTDIDGVLNSIEENKTSKRTGVSLFVVDFKSTSNCDCIMYDNLERKFGNSLIALNAFK